MKSLKALVEAGIMSFEQKTDLMLSVIEHIDAGYKIPLSLDGYAVRDNGSVAFTEPSNDISLASPEMFGIREASARDRQWFTLGLLGYYIFHGKTYYEEKKMNHADIIELSLSSPSTGCLIEDGLFDGMLGLLTSWAPQEREKGISVFLNFLRSNFVSRLRADFFCGSELVRSEDMSINGVVYSYPSADVITGNNGKQYRVDERIFIPFRLVPKKYRINVSPAETVKSKPVTSASLLLSIDELVAARRNDIEIAEKTQEEAECKRKINPLLEYFPKYM